MALDDYNAVELLQWYADVGVDEAVGDAPVDRTKLVEKPAVVAYAPAAAPLAPVNFAVPSGPATVPVIDAGPGSFEALGDARMLAASAKSLEELREALDGFKAIALKRTATQMVFADGNPAAKVMLVGEAPGADEDRIGRPFVGVSGQLLDRMMGAIGLSREESIYISNLINWRPPGNRDPSDAEMALSLPFIQRHIELVKPEVLLFVGGVSAKALLQTTDGITKLRGRWREYQTPGLEKPVAAMAIFHPAYLLRSPQQKGLAWADLQKVRNKLRELGILPPAA